MPGTKAGGIKTRDKNKEKDPEYYSKIGSRGGQKKNPLKGFGSNRDLASTAGKLGGKISRRSAAK